MISRVGIILTVTPVIPKENCSDHLKISFTIFLFCKEVNYILQFKIDASTLDLVVVSQMHGHGVHSVPTCLSLPRGSKHFLVRSDWHHSNGIPELDHILLCVNLTQSIPRRTRHSLITN